MLNLLWISTTMFLSLILGAMIFALLGIYLPDQLDWFMAGGDFVADQIYHMDIITSQVRNALRFLIDAKQMVFLFFVISSRIFLTLIGSIIGIRT